jgi:hypothetical protein
VLPGVCEVTRASLREERGREEAEPECESARQHSRRYAAERERFREEKARATERRSCVCEIFPSAGVGCTSL